MTPIKMRRDPLRPRDDHVSILVLLDDSHQEAFGDLFGELDLSFNPCSSG